MRRRDAAALGLAASAATALAARLAATTPAPRRPAVHVRASEAALLDVADDIEATGLAHGDLTELPGELMFFLADGVEPEAAFEQLHATLAHNGRDGAVWVRER